MLSALQKLFSPLIPFPAHNVEHNKENVEHGEESVEPEKLGEPMEGGESSETTQHDTGSDWESILPDSKTSSKQPEVKPEDLNPATATNYENWRVINGRRYHSKWCNADYIMPNDERATTFQNQLNTCIMLLEMNSHIQSPSRMPKFGQNLERILDVGVGTGRWARRTAEDFPYCEVIGTDISPTQDGEKPRNLTYLMEDFTSPDGWSFPDNHFDFIHMQCLTGSVTDWDAFFHEAWRVLKPGGWFESIEWTPHAWSMIPGFHQACPALSSMGKLLEKAGANIGRCMNIDSDDLDRSLRIAGFRVESSITPNCPINRQQQDGLKYIATQCLRRALDADIEGKRSDYTGFCRSGDSDRGYLARALREGLGWNDDLVQRYTDSLKRELEDEGVLNYFRPFINFQFKTGWKKAP
ncbi:hypothetical protein O1611_g4726 [Lasiodiplodia mahajangana]|uniref:Uncharacterized protein n=1 Tax=Lasiodiplodia mahajangana TaxID=1108764 RepID=A0ACC2JNT6_9PEZI|nr:hypothetical protein O1611_g4726 [Lasiodiplodia mahajangana]